jgi:serine protease
MKLKSVFFILVLSSLSATSAFAKNPIWIIPDTTVTTPASATPLFVNSQTYLEDAPMGVGAKSSWAIKGGTGEFLKLVDIEVTYETTHEDFNTPFYIGNNPIDQDPDTNHGTAVWGEIAAKNDSKGVTGIAYGIQYGVYGFIEGDLDDMSDAYKTGINTAIQGAIDHLDAGDVMVIEQEMNGPIGDTSVDYWPEILAQLKKATDKGILCVEAAGNGGNDLDSTAYNGAFDLTKFDSGCIMVGAADPTDHDRMSFSNYGSRIDAFGIGTDVTTTGYGDLFSGGPNRDYTSSFNGTSSATPIVAGAVAVVSSIAKAQGKIITPLEMRAALRATGTPQGTTTSAQRIGTLPNIPELLKFLGLS